MFNCDNRDDQGSSRRIKEQCYDEGLSIMRNDNIMFHVSAFYVYYTIEVTHVKTELVGMGVISPPVSPRKQQIKVLLGDVN